MQEKPKKHDNALSFVLILLVQIYQAIVQPTVRILSLVTFGHYSACPQRPSCSQYTILQIRKHGTITGLKKGALRIWNCHAL